MVRHNDGTITLAIREFQAIEQANAELERLSLRVRVVPAKPANECTETKKGLPGFLIMPIAPDRGNAIMEPDESGSGALKIWPDRIPPGTTLQMSDWFVPRDERPTVAIIGVVEGDAGPCVALPDPAFAPSVVPPGN